MCLYNVERQIVGGHIPKKVLKRAHPVKARHLYRKCGTGRIGNVDHGW